MGKYKVCHSTHNQILEGEERERRTENVFEKIVAENFTNVIMETYIQIQEAQRVLNKTNPSRLTPRHVKMANIKERILRATREEQGVHYKEIPRRLSADFSTETLQTRREWQNIFKVLKGKICNLEYSIQKFVI